MNNYALNKPDSRKKKVNIWRSLQRFTPFLVGEKKRLLLAMLAVFINAGLNLLAPVLIGHTVDAYILTKQYSGVLTFSIILLTMYVVALIANYFQTMFMGTVGQHLLFNLRNAIFSKIQSLPVAFFNQNKAGDLISRINNDTDKLNQFFSQSIHQFIANVITIIGAGIFIVTINWRLGLATLAPALLLLIFTRIISPWIKRTNAANLKTIGGLSAEISESLDNFKVIVAFNRRDYFRRKFHIANETNYHSAISVGIANNTLTPAYGLASNLAQIIVIGYGLYLISIGSFTLGILISFLTYVSRFYDPLKQMATIWSNFQTALAGWDRINDILSLRSDLSVTPVIERGLQSDALLEFRNVSFRYAPDKEVLRQINFRLEPGKTYALVGPTGGGKTTTASLIARLYDPSEGTIFLHGQDLHSYETRDRVQRIGFILQEPFLFTGTIRDNILYGNDKYKNYNNEQLATIIKEAGLETLLIRFDEGLETKIATNGGTLSLGQKQLVAFIRAVLRNPDILILDEATANIDTVTEQLLEEILDKLPAKTTKVIIAHRLNTIANADEIFFVNGGDVICAGSMANALDMLLHEKRAS
ncbi:ABC transporter ATP-binding protein/permease [Candidatus Parcubacteria bacterium]|nr:ABC transporter ATP-binding protein/permease [Patescibacteria group bacterium]MBU4309907.1 ABC transporter ATP-binding protein/permease [Patescibacteria group bacterium]MBU4432537.1 ABC transporter ATP-binding protein/permease [Patescibacteria group bacterium]MBU4577832.1 ABC transporter ATP-binding protein/permease [Patescibacteria group bacterium]MCG2696893.1 ABC transporter ATP-binding protein/permease [Candidatus Parcubacteria bacterium]